MKGLHKDSLRKVDNPHQWMIDDARMELIQQIKAEIERQRKEIRPTDTGEMKVVGTPTQLEQGWLNALSWMEKALDTLQEQPVKGPFTGEQIYNFLKEQPVELEKEIESYLEGWYDDIDDGGYRLRCPDGSVTHRSVERLARHFYELGRSEKPTIQEQPVKIDFRKELESIELMGVNDARDTETIARHFYELGRQSKKRELLPMIGRVCVSCPEKVKAESALNKFISKYCVHCSIEHCPGVKACYTSSNEQLQ